MCCVNNECLIIVCVLSLIRCLIVPTTNTCFTEKQESAVATIVIRGATDNIMDDIERAIDDGVNTFKALTKVCICLTSLTRAKCGIPSTLCWKIRASSSYFFLFFPIFLSILLFFLFFSNFLLFFLFFSHFTYNKQIFVRYLNILSLFRYVVYRVH